jgi:hypothetical protein
MDRTLTPDCMGCEGTDFQRENVGLPGVSEQVPRKVRIFYKCRKLLLNIHAVRVTNVYIETF